MAGPNDRASIVRQLASVLAVSEGQEISKELTDIFKVLTNEELKTAQTLAAVEKAKLTGANQLERQRAKIDGDRAMLELKNTLKQTDAELSQSKRLFDIRAKGAEQRVNLQPGRAAFREAARIVDPIKIRSGEVDARLVNATLKELEPLAAKDPRLAVKFAELKAAQSSAVDKMVEDSVRIAESAAAKSNVSLTPQQINTVKAETLAAQRPFHQQGEAKLKALIAESRELAAARNAEMIATNAAKGATKGAMLKGGVLGGAAALILPALLGAFGGSKNEAQGQMNPALLQAMMAQQQAGQGGANFSKSLIDANRILNMIAKMSNMNAATPQPVAAPLI